MWLAIKFGCYSERSSRVTRRDARGLNEDQEVFLVTGRCCRDRVQTREASAAHDTLHIASMMSVTRHV